MATAALVGWTIACARPAPVPDRPLTPPAGPEPREPTGPFEGIYAWSTRDDAPLGIGRLFPADRPPLAMPAGWVRDIALPLLDSPAGEVRGWVHRGWLHVGSLMSPFDLSGMVETEYEDLSFIVTDTTVDGWLRIRFGAPEAPLGGLAWVHTDHLDLGAVALRFETWTARFLSDEIGPLHMRGAAPWSVHVAPSAAAAIIGLVTEDHAIEPIAFEGEWLRARIRQPADHCTGEPLDVVVTEGWVRWWASARGPLVWYATRGC